MDQLPGLGLAMRTLGSSCRAINKRSIKVSNTWGVHTRTRLRRVTEDVVGFNGAVAMAGCPAAIIIIIFEERIILGSALDA